MAEFHHFWSFYKDASCAGVPTGVFVKALNDCENQVEATGLKCVAQTNSTGVIVGYVDESCHEGDGRAGRVGGLNTLYKGEPYMAYDYYNDKCKTSYENSAAYRTNGECGSLYALGPGGVNGIQFRSATISISDANVVIAQSEGSVDGALNCPGPGGEGYYELDVDLTDLNNAQSCKRVDGKGGGFQIYNTTTDSSISASSSGSASSQSKTPGSDISSSSSSSSSTTSSSSLAIGTIVGIGCAIVIIIVAIIVLACCFLKRNKRNENANTPSMQHPFLPRGSAWTDGTTDDSEPPTLGPGLWNDNIIIANRVPRDNVSVQNLICRGGFGEIYRGTYNREPVAIKMLFPEMRSDLKKVNSFLAEAKLMAGLVHPHIVRFVGVAWGSLTDLCVLSEFMEGGDLRALLKEYEAQNHPQGINYDKIRIAYQIAQALTYLHSLSPVVIHRDLKSKNVLLTENLDAKVTDFGVSRERQERTMTAGVGTMLWMAPEVMMATHYDESADIFSFGVLLSELDLQCLPYAHARIDSVTGKKVPDAVILQKVSSGSLQVSFSTGCLASVAKLAKECVAVEPSSRPSAPMVVFRLQTIMKESFGDGYII
ncbi:TKL protein kinase [Phytophthora megakarya]|uniref:TKL protein kinase n=1 Tax=Phytophthora megakarya TaxID=4795 RepID=A0A225WDW7_9STRA|nr:TKL protein kinase [Phytophthora megakarya]